MIKTALNRNAGCDEWMANIMDRLVDRDYVAIPISFRDDYVFNEEEANRLNGKAIVPIEMMEFGYYSSWRNTVVMGVSFDHERVIASNGEYQKLHEWLSRQNIVCYFKRELSREIQNRSYPFPIYPVDLLAQYFHPASYNKDQWMRRLGNVFHLYGHSHQDRKILHGALQAKWDHTINCLEMMSSTMQQGIRFSLLQEVPHYCRYPMDYVLASQSGCLLSVALPGYGVKAFRNSEVCQASLPVVADHGIRFAVPWTEENCILLPTENGSIKVSESVDILEKSLQDPEALYPKFEQATYAGRQLQPDNFVANCMNKYILEHV